MANELLKSALRKAGLDVAQLAGRINVDPKTVQRWVDGRTPYPRHRANIAVALNTTERELWPDATPRSQTAGDRGEILGAWAHADDPAAPDWREHLATAVEQIDLLDLTLTDILRSPSTIETLARRATDGCRVRILLSAPDSAHLTLTEIEHGLDTTLADRPALARDVERTIGRLQPLLTLPGVQARAFVTAPSHRTLRFDEHMLLTLHTHGTPTHRAPLLHLRHDTDDGLFDQFARHFEHVWDHASEPVRPDPDRYPDPTRNRPSATPRID